jgi:hypothetical protein
MRPENRLRLLARAEARIFQCVVIDPNYVKRNIAVYVCGTDAFWAPNREGLFDPDRARTCPKWLIDQVLAPSASVDLYAWNGKKIGGEEDGPSEMPRAEVSVSDADLEGESAIGQG